jgi:hypothetical protein
LNGEEIMAAAITKKKINLKKVSPKTLAMSTLAGLLAACNSDSDSADVIAPIVTTTSLSGAVVKGPLSGALVYADNDGDGIGDGDPIITAADGSYTISASNANATIIAMSGPNTVDTSSGETLSGITLKAPAGSTVVTPATTILEAQPDIEPAQLAIALGIPTNAADGSAIDIMSFNPYAAGADPAAALAAEKAAQQVMITIKAVSAAAEGAGMNIDDAFEQAMASVAEVVSTEAAKIDITSTASIAAAEASMATNKVDFSDSTVLEAVSTAVQEKVTAAAVADTTIVIDETAFAAVLSTAVTAVGNVNAAIEAITDTDLTSTESMGTFATLTDMAAEIKAAAVAEVATPGSGAALVTFTDAAAVTTAVAAAVIEVESYVVETAAIAAGEDPAVAAAAAAAAAEVAAAAEAVAAAAAAAADAAAAEAEALAAVAVAEAQKGYFMISGLTGASWDGASAENQQLNATISGGVYDIISDIQVEADDFTAAFDDASVNTNGGQNGGPLGLLSITNLTPPTVGSGNNKEITVTILESGTTGKIVAGFTMDWSFSGSDYTFTSDDDSLDIEYTERDNSSTTVNIANPTLNTMTIANDGTYGANSTLNIDALGLITKLNAVSVGSANAYTFDNLEARFAVPGVTLEVAVDVTNLGVYYGVTQVTSITSTIDIV